MRILNFGSMNLDSVYRIEHFVQPGETITARSVHVFCGGKGLNQSIAMARAGVAVHHAGRIGPDGRKLLDALASEGVDTSDIVTVDVPTGAACIQVDRKGQNAILLSGGANRTIDPPFIDRVLSGYGEGDRLVLQNEISGLDSIVKCGIERGMRICLNPSPVDETVFALPLDLLDTLILNEIEGRALTGRTNPDEILNALLARAPKLAVVLTLGKAGVRYGHGDERRAHGIFEVPVIDTTAAGDTFTGFYLAAEVRGLPVEERLAMASAASSLAVSRKGASDSIPCWNEALAFRERNRKT